MSSNSLAQAVLTNEWLGEARSAKMVAPHGAARREGRGERVPAQRTMSRATQGMPNLQTQWIAYHYPPKPTPKGETPASKEKAT